MEANRTVPGECSLTYTQCDWGDLIKGTKAQLQAIGLAVGLSFPGETGGPKRQLNVKDHRGYATQIERSFDDDSIFTASLTFPGWPVSPWNQPQRWEPAFPGVDRRDFFCGRDEYRGSAEALVAAGLVPSGHFPGWPGMRKVRVTIFTDGTIPTGAPTAKHARASEPGARTVARAAAGKFVVAVNLASDERAKRREVLGRAEDAYLVQVRSMTRPAPLVEPTSSIRVPARDAQTQREQDQKELLSLPQTPAAFLRHGAEKFWGCAMAARDLVLTNEAHFGFKLDADSLEEFMDLVGGAYWAIRNGGTEGKSPRVKLQNLRFAKARRDQSLQAFLERMRIDES